MKTSLNTLIVLSSILLAFVLLYDGDTVFAKEHGDDSKDNDEDSKDNDEDSKDNDEDSKFVDNNAIQICCAWGPELADGILTYSFEDKDKNLQSSTIKASDAWNEVLNGVQLNKTKTDGDVLISFRNDGKKVAGETINHYDSDGFIRKSHITISKEYYTNEFTPAQLEQIVKHELGHVLGMDHANFNGNLMSSRVETGSGIIAPCEIEAVNTADAWKIKEGGLSMHTPTEEFVNC
jgi:Matrixin